MAKVIRSHTVRQIASCTTVADELKYWLDLIQTCWHGAIVNVFETKVNRVPDLSDQGFIILWEREE